MKITVIDKGYGQDRATIIEVEEGTHVVMEDMLIEINGVDIPWEPDPPGPRKMSTHPAQTAAANIDKLGKASEEALRRWNRSADMRECEA